MKINISVILSRPENPENIGLVARAMMNTGFEKLRLVTEKPPDDKMFVTAVHSREILNRAEVFSTLQHAVSDLNVVFASTAKKRKNFTLLTLTEAVEKMLQFSSSTRIGLLFGNERTGLTSKELLYSNFRFEIPQAFGQPSFNLAGAVLITLFSLSCAVRIPHEKRRERPLPQKEQHETIRLILLKLKEKGFVHSTNEQHMTEMIFDLLGRLAMTAKDRRLLLALFTKGVDGK